jgi:predicted nucleotidyltransferase
VYYGSTQNTLFRERKKQYNIQHLRESGLIDFLEKSLCPKCIVLFGSYQKGEDVETSDIDLYLECDKTEISVEMYQKRLKRRIQLHFNKDFTQLPRELKNNIVNGTIMRGFLEAYK